MIGEVTLHVTKKGVVVSNRVDVEVPGEDKLLLRCKNEDEAVEWMMALVK